jgi:hypothetical protein
MNYEIWPGIGLSDDPVEWTKVLGSAVLSAKSTANVDRRRKTDGKDFSTFKGISHKSDETSRRGPPKTMRRGGPGDCLHPESRSGRIRTALQYGPMTRAEITAMLDLKSESISAYLRNDIKQGRIVVIQKEGCLQKFALSEAP